MSLLKNSFPIHGIYKEQDVMIPMRDGVKLATDIYRPSNGKGDPVDFKVPAILVRTSYDKTSNERKEKFLSRQKQIEIAKSRGTEHFGPQIKK